MDHSLNSTNAMSRSDLSQFEPLKYNGMILNNFKVSVDIETNHTSKSMAIYRVTINYKTREWFVLQHLSGFERLLKFLRKSNEYKLLLKSHNATKLPKKPMILTAVFASKPDFIAGVTNFVMAIFSEIKLLRLEEVQIFFAMNKQKIKVDYNNNRVSNHKFSRPAHNSLTDNTYSSVDSSSSSKTLDKNLMVKSTSYKTNLAQNVYNTNVPNFIKPTSPNSILITSSTNSTAPSTPNESIKSDSLMSKNQLNIHTFQNYKKHVSTSSSSRSSEPTTLEKSDPWNIPMMSNPSKASDFEFLKLIGKGSFGKVLLAYHKHDKKYFAVKVLHKQTIIKRNEQYHIMAERNVLSKTLKHPFLVSLHYSFQTPEKLYFVLDYANGGELFFHLQKERIFSEPRAKFYAAEIGSAIGYMHDENILYRDLKPENLLLDRDGHVVITDFGLCKENILDEPTSTFCGTPEYLAPEVLAKKPYGKAIDWWSFGCVLYEMLYGLPPFYSKNTHEMYHSILNSPLVFKTRATASAKSVLESLLQKNPKKRLGSSARDFKEIQETSFFKNINFKQLLLKNIRPPFNPNVSDETDLSNIDESFKKLSLPGSVINPRLHPVGQSLNVPGVFDGFSYVRPSVSEFLDLETDC